MLVQNFKIHSSFRDGIYLHSGVFNSLNINSEEPNTISIKGNKLDFINKLEINGIGNNTLINHQRINKLELKGKFNSESLLEVKNLKINILKIDELNNKGTVKFINLKPINYILNHKGFEINSLEFEGQEVKFLPKTNAFDLYEDYNAYLERYFNFFLKEECNDSVFKIFNSSIGNLEFDNSNIDKFKEIKINSKLSSIKTFGTVFPTKSVSGDNSTLYEVFNDLYSVAKNKNNKNEEVLYYRKALNSLRKSVWKKEGNIFMKLNDWASLGVSNLYSAYGTSWIRSFFIATPIIAFIFFGGMLLTTNYDLAFSIDGFSENIANFFKFLNPTHKLNFMDREFYKYSDNAWFVIFDLFGRIFVGIGIFETIRSFRKYSRK
ncbi:hypothetical protein [uncultured Tenacibaculum sp.]|uniref:hypothetical protein n=1 Tax=uncultured Tenacibaculum sp. TaxID=174713 RepID=UPI0026075D96|nr:hypothetical protein [uncultured Tenacibaculum sp.]